MTKNEFILRAMLQMAANPKYVTIKKDEDKNGDIVEYPAIDDEIIFIDAEALANEAEKRLDKPFENEGETPLEIISDSLDDIRSYLNNPHDTDTELSAPQEIAKSIWDIEGHLRNIAASTSDIADNG